MGLLEALLEAAMDAFLVSLSGRALFWLFVTACCGLLLMLWVFS